MASTQDAPSVLIVALDPSQPTFTRPLSAAEYAALQPQHRRVLRAALAMRGGVSLAVWIGGAVAEIDVWRRIRICRAADGTSSAVLIPPAQGTEIDTRWVDRAVRYARVLDSRGFDAVEFDVMAGASAGGLNSVMYAVAQRAGASVDGLLTTWRDVGGAWNLMHPPGFRRLDSILRGDDYFWPQVLTALRNFYDPSITDIHPAHRASRITVDLSATIVDSEDSSERGTKEGKGHFHFVGSDDDTANERGRNIPAAGDPAADASLARLAYAARTTSSFPGAFEPALIFSKTTTPDAVGNAADAGSIDMSFAFHAHRNDWSHPFRVIDGAVLDNIPIDRAFRAIRGMASTVNASRALIYLDPSPPIQPLASVRPTAYGVRAGQPAPTGPRRVIDRVADRRSQLLSGVAAGRGKRGIRESGEDEEDEVERFRLQLAQAQGRSDSLAVLSNAAVARYDLADARRAYIRFRSTTDLQLLTLTLANPSLWQLGTNLPTRQNWTAWSSEERSALAHCFTHEYEGLSRADESAPFAEAITLGPSAVIDATLCALNWVRALEELPQDGNIDDSLDAVFGGSHEPRDPPLPVASIATLRTQLYGVLALATDARDIALRRVLDETDAHRRLPDFPRRAPALGEVAGARATELAASVVTSWVRASAAAVAQLENSWQTLDACLITLRSASPGPSNPYPGWRESPYAGVPTRRTEFDARDLAPFLAATGIPEPISTLTYWRITGDEAPAKPEEYTTLIDRKVRAATVAALTLPHADLDADVVARLFSDRQLGSDEKLAGTSLFNFAGFLSKHWRSNDWWWGRLDAAAGMTRLVASYPSPGKTEPDDLAPTIDAVQSSVLADAAASDSGPFSGIPGTAEATDTRARFAMGGDSIDNLEPGYVVAVLSRTIRVASRSFSGSAGTATRFLIAALRPLLVVVPIALNPMRQALVAAILGVTIAIAAAAAYLPARRPDIFSFLPGYALILVIGLGLVAATVGVLRTWTKLIALMRVSSATRHSRILALVLDLRRESAWQGAVYAFFSLVTLVVAAVELWTEGLSVSYWILVASAAVLGARARLRARSPSEEQHRVLLYGAGIVAYNGWLVFVVLLPDWVQSLRWDTGTLLPITVAVAGFLVSSLLTLSWLPVIGALNRTWFLNWLTVSLAAGAASGVIVYVATHVRGTGFGVLNSGTAVVLVVLVWGSIVWWLPEIPEGTSKRWKAFEVPDDLRRTYRVRRESPATVTPGPERETTTPRRRR
jgi:predicted acylesterase/phospholipase RssA